MPRPRRSFEESSHEQAVDKATRWLSVVSLFAALSSVLFFFIRDVFDLKRYADQQDWLLFVVAPMAALVVLLSLLTVFYWARYRAHRLPRAFPTRRRLNKSVEGLSLDRRLPSMLWRPRGNPPLLGVNQDYSDAIRIQQGELPESFALKSLKWGSMDDLVQMARLGGRLGALWKTAHADSDLSSHVLGMCGVDVVESHSQAYGTRSLISIGGSDTNALSSHIAKEYAQGYGGYPPLRFLTATSESIIARTEVPERMWLASETELHQQHESSYGMVVATRAPRPRIFRLPGLWAVRAWTDFRKRKPVHVIVAGLHGIGSYAASTALSSCLKKLTQPSTYRFFQGQSMIQPFAILSLTTPSINRPISLQFHSINAIRHEVICAPLPEGPLTNDSDSDVWIIIPRGLRDHDPEDRSTREASGEFMPLRGACRVIDLAVQYGFEHSIPHVRLDVHKIVHCDTTVEEGFTWETTLDGQQFLAQLIRDAPNLSELILIGTEAQNEWVKKLRKIPEIELALDKLSSTIHDIKESGGYSIFRIQIRPDRQVTIAFAFGTAASDEELVVRSTQTAIVALLSQLRARRLAKLIPDHATSRLATAVSLVESYPLDRDINIQNLDVEANN